MMLDAHDGADRGSEVSSLSPQAQAFLASNRAARIPGPLLGVTARLIRRLLARAAASELDAAVRASGVSVVTRSFGGVGVAEVLPSGVAADGAGDGYVVYVHGGAFFLGEALDVVAVRLAQHAELPVFSVEYDLSPQVRFPRALEQCVAAWDAIGREHSGRRVLAGVSAGGNLALALLAELLRRHQAGEPGALPDAVVLMTPWADLAAGAGERLENEGRDPAIRWSGQLDKASRVYAADVPLTDPRVSPIHQSWEGLDAPVLVTTGTRDLFLPDCVRLARSLQDAGVEVTLDVADGLWHAYQATAVPEAEASLRRIAAFITEGATST